MKRGHLLSVRRAAALTLSILLVMVIPAPAIGAKVEATTRIILSGKMDLRPVSQTHLLMVQDETSGLWGVYGTDGQQRIEPLFHQLSYLDYGWFSDTSETGLSVQTADTSAYGDLFSVSFTEAGAASSALNNKALVSPDGTFVSAYEYGMIRLYNDRWAAGWVLTNGTEEDFDYTPDKNKTLYQIRQCDLFSLAGTPRLVASLTRDQFAAAAAHGEYLSIEDRAGAVTLYDADFQPVPLIVAKTSDSVYGIADYALVNRLTGEILLDGFTAVKEINHARGLLFQVTRTDLRGVKQTGLWDPCGQWLIPLSDLTIKTVSTDYAVVTRDSRAGLYSYELGRLVVPCEYDSIASNAQANDPYISYGYACGIRDGIRYYINVNNGTAGSVVPVDKSIKLIGGTAYTAVTRQSFAFTAASGKTWRIKDEKVATTRGDGRLIICRDVLTGLYCVYNMNGVQVLGYKYKNQPVVTDDGYVILNTAKNGYQLIAIDW